MNGRKCEVSNLDVHRAYYAKHLRGRKHLGKGKLIEMVIPEWLFQAPIENKVKKLYNPKTLKQIAK